MNYGRKKLSKSKHQQQARRTLKKFKNGEKKGSRRKEMWIQSLRSTYFIGKKRIQWSKALCIPKRYAASLNNGEQKQALQAWKVGSRDMAVSPAPWASPTALPIPPDVLAASL